MNDFGDGLAGTAKLIPSAPSIPAVLTPITSPRVHQRPPNCQVDGRIGLDDIEDGALPLAGRLRSRPLTMPMLDARGTRPEGNWKAKHSSAKAGALSLKFAGGNRLRVDP